MIELREATVLATDVEETFELVADFGRLVEWDPGVVASERTSGGRFWPESTYSIRVRFLGRTPEVEYELLDVDRPHRVVYEGRAAWMTARDTLELSPVDDGTLLRASTEIELDDRVSRGAWLIRRVLERQARASLSRLEAVCASRARAREEGAER